MPLVSCLNPLRGLAGDALAAMNRLHIDCPTGLAGDMLLAAFLDLGVPLQVIETPLATLGLHDRYRLDVEEARSGGLRGKRLSVTATESAPQHRHWAEIRRSISDAALAPELRERVLAVFTALAEAEATVHGVAADAVHFHEVGAIDALVDVVGVCSAVDHLALWQSVVPLHRQVRARCPQPTVSCRSPCRRFWSCLDVSRSLCCAATPHRKGSSRLPQVLPWLQPWPIDRKHRNRSCPSRLASGSAIGSWIAPICFV